MVARTIAARDAIGVRRQVFFVGAGGFDNHAFLNASHPPLLKMLADALDSFYAATVELGVADAGDDVHGERLRPRPASNGDGSDHGWGAHHLVDRRRGARRPRLRQLSDGRDRQRRRRRPGPPDPDDLGRAVRCDAGGWMGVSPTALADIWPHLGRFASGEPGLPGVIRMCPGKRTIAAAIVLATSLAAAWPAPTAAQGVPFWQRLLRWAAATAATRLWRRRRWAAHADERAREPAPPATQRAPRRSSRAARRVLERYRDVADAERDGYRPFAPRGVVGEEVHYTHLWEAGREVQHASISERPGSILYRRTATGMEAVGVMYTARGDAGPERARRAAAAQHRRLAPPRPLLRLAEGHAARRLRRSRGRASARGSIDTEADCRAAGGYWIPLAFGWMTHVYPDESDPERIWLGEHAMHLPPAPEARPAAGRAGHSHPH